MVDTAGKGAVDIRSSDKYAVVHSTVAPNKELSDARCEQTMVLRVKCAFGGSQHLKVPSLYLKASN